MQGAGEIRTADNELHGTAERQTLAPMPGADEIRAAARNLEEWKTDCELPRMRWSEEMEWGLCTGVGHYQATPPHNRAATTTASDE